MRAPAIASDVTAGFHVSGAGPAMSGRAQLSPSTIAGAAVGGGTVLEFGLSDAGFRYAARGAVRGLDLQQVAHGLGIDARASNRFSSAIAGRFDVEGTRDRLVGASIVLTDSRLFGASVPAATVRAAETPEGWQFGVDGQFTALDLAAFGAGAKDDGALAGHLNVSGSVTGLDDGFEVSSDLAVEGRVTLDRSAVAGMTIADGVIAARLAGGALHLADARLAGPEWQATAAGTFGLDRHVATDVRFDVKGAPLGPIGEMFGRPLEGTASLEGTIAGAEMLVANGSFAVPHLEYGGTGASEVRVGYTVSVPRAAPSSFTASAHVAAASVEVAGRTLTGVAADLAFAAPDLTFGLQFVESNQTADLGGRIAWHPSHQEIHLERLRLTSGPITWRLAPAASSTIEYRGESIRVSDLRLVGGSGESLAIEGALGDAGKTMRVEASGIDLSNLGPLVGRPDLRGRADLRATIEGTLAAPAVTAAFTVVDGRFRGFPYTRLAGTIDTRSAPVTLDVRLEPSAGSWIEAKGRLPRTLLPGARAGPAEDRAADAFDLTVRSSAIPLNLVETFTDQVEGVTGTAHADIHVTGTSSDPRVEGRIDLRDGAFAVPRLGTRYSGVTTTIDLEPDLVTVHEFKLLDDDKHWLTVSGRLPVDERRVGAVDLNIRSDRLEIVDNEYADVEVAANLRVTGNLRQPQVSGSLRMTSGTIRVDEIFARPAPAGSRRHAPSAAPSDPITIQATAPPGLLEDLPIALDVTLELPAVLVEGRDLRGRGRTPIGLGDVNVTAGGLAHVRKTATTGLEIVGDIEVVRGTYEFQGRQFEISRDSRVRFTGLPSINPSIDITATREVSAVLVTVRISGTLDEPGIVLSSSPPLDEADILSLLVFNRPANQLDAASQISLSRRAGALALGFVAGQLTEALDDAIGVDLIDIEAKAVGEGIAPVVTLGHQFGDLFVKVQRRFGPGQSAEFVVEYRLTDWIRLQSTIADRAEPSRVRLRRVKGSGADLVFTIGR
jgi:autotransporter translocation and assembly factor TamB